MTVQDLPAILPFIVLSSAAVAVMLSIAIRRSHFVVVLLTLAGFALSLACIALAVPSAPRAVGNLLIIDNYALFFSGLLIAAGLAVAMISQGYLKRQPARREEFYLLLLLASLGAAVLAAANHFASFFLALELLSVSLYALIGYERRSVLGVEAALKYLVLAGASSALLLFGMALAYAALGTMQFDQMSRLMQAQPHGALLPAGLGLIVVGFGFKLALAPFHFWTPDVYQGASAPVSAFIASVSKAGMFALLLRYFAVAEFRNSDALVVTFMLLSVASMFTGNLLALRQDSVKRILAYSSIAQLGYVLVAFLASGLLGARAVMYYLVAYVVTMLGAFGVVAAISGPAGEADNIEDFSGLAWRRPALAAVMTGSLLSLAGLPLTAGFVGKFYVLLAGVHSGLWLLVVLLAINSALGLFYYLRIVSAMYRSPDERRRRPLLTPPVQRIYPLPLLGGIALAAILLALVALGVYPSPLVRLIEAVTAGLF